MTSIQQLLTELVSIDSTNPDLIPGAAGEEKVAHHIARWLEDAGLEVRLIEAAPGRPNVVATAHGSGGGRTLLLNGHMDTVAPGGMSDPYKPSVRAGRLYGRGSYDMKSGLAACMQAIALAGKEKLRGDVVLTAVVDEEYASLGTSEVVKHIKADGAIVAEFTELKMILAHKGFVWFDIETLGVAAHGSRPDLGVDAIAHMGRVLTQLEQMDRSLREGPQHPLLGPGSLHASLIRGGREVSSYPELCTLTVERRTIPGESEEQVESDIARMLHELQARDPAFKFRLRRGFGRSPLETPEQADITRAVQSAATKVLGHPAPVAGVAFWADAAILASAGIPSLLFGPSGAGAHADEEWVDLASVEACADVYLQTAREFCG